MRTPADPAVSQFGQDPDPEAGALGLLDPHPKNLFNAIYIWLRSRYGRP